MQKVKYNLSTIADLFDVIQELVDRNNPEYTDRVTKLRCEIEDLREDMFDQEALSMKPQINKDIEKLNKLTNTTEIPTEKLDRVYSQVLLPEFERWANKNKKSYCEIRDNVHNYKCTELMKELFNGKINLQTLVETQMRPYLESKGYKIITYQPSYLVKVAW